MRFIAILMVVLPLWGQVRWERFYGGAGEEAGFAVSQWNGGFTIAGHTNSRGNGGFDFYVVRITSNGDTLWTRTAGGAADDFAKCVIPSDDGGVVVGGLTYSFGAGNSDVYIVKFDSLGDTLWTRTFGGAIADEVYSGIRTGFGYLFTGRTYSFGAGNFDVYLLAVDDNGDTLWTKTYGGAITDGANSVIPTENGFLLTGYTYSFGHGNYDVYVLRVDSAGNLLWENTYGGIDDDVGTDAVRLPDGGFLIVGYTYTFTNGSDDIFVVRIDGDGNLLWQRHYGGSGLDEAYTVVRRGTAYLMGGDTESQGNGRRDAYILAIDENGEVLGEHTFGYADNDGCRAILIASDGDAVFTGYSRYAGSYEAYAVRFHSDESVEGGGFEAVDPWISVNPVSQTGIVMRFSRNTGMSHLITVFDAGGRMLARARLAADATGWQWKPPKTGVYLVEVKTGAAKFIRKVLYVG